MSYDTADMKEIEVFDRNGLVKASFTIDDEDFVRVSEHRWFLNASGYICHSKLGRLSRWLLKCTDPKVVVDHIDRCRTNNCRANLRLASQSLNVHNKTRSAKHTNRYVGVTLNKRQQKWEVKVANISYGKYTNEDHAARVYNHFATFHYGENANLNDVPADPNFVPPTVQRRTSKGEGGVYYYPPSRKWGCRPIINGAKLWLGYHDTKEKALVVLHKALKKESMRVETLHLQTPITRNDAGVAIIPVKSGNEIRNALVDDCWWHILMKRRWSLPEGSYVTCGIAMHLWIMREERVVGKVIDHINNDRLDNRKANLRVASHSQNAQNRTANPVRKLPQGVQKTPEGNYQANIKFQGKVFCLGRFSTPEKAAFAYDKKALELYGEHAKTNHTVK